jgi:prolyl oligopeptidase PreP (S9A serine peptidase family)
MAKALASYSPFHNVRDDVEIPALSGNPLNEGRPCWRWPVRKLVAQLKGSGAAKYYLSEERDGGHEVSDAFKKTGLMSRRMSFFVIDLIRYLPYVGSR